MSILIINPNSSATVTNAIRSSVGTFAGASVIGLADMPPTIASEADVATASLRFAAEVRAHPEALAYISACFSDPGVQMAREITKRPVIGIMEASIMTALARADRFGIIAMSPTSLGRHRRRMREMGVEARCAGELPLPLGTSAAATGSDPAVFERACALSEALAEAGAGVLILGCAGMGPVRARIEAAVGIPVIDPVLAALAMAQGFLATAPSEE